MKQGIDYFPLDTIPDDRMELIEAEFGMTGFGMVVRLMQTLFGREGYYLPWTEERQMLMAHKMGESREKLEQVVEACLRCGIFDRELYEREKVLTSREVQEQFLTITARRRNRRIRPELLLVELPPDCARDAAPAQSAPPAQSAAPARKEEAGDHAAVRQTAPPQPRLRPPTLTEVSGYCRERNSSVDPVRFMDYYNSNGWKVCGRPMTDWKSTFQRWEQLGFEPLESLRGLKSEPERSPPPGIPARRRSNGDARP